MSDLLVGNNFKYSKAGHKLTSNTLQTDYTYTNSVSIPSRNYYNDNYDNFFDKTIYD